MNESEEDSSIQYGNRRGDDGPEQRKDAEDASPNLGEQKLSEVKDDSPTENIKEEEAPAQKSSEESPYMNPDTNEELQERDQEEDDDQGEFDDQEED